MNTAVPRDAVLLVRDFVNTIEWQEDHDSWTNPGDLERWFAERADVVVRAQTERDLLLARRLREGLRSILLRHAGHEPLPDADAHAGETETSLLRHLAPWAVRVDLMSPGATEPVAELMPRLRADGVRAVSPNGVLGDPTTSSAERGRELFERLVSTLVAELVSLDVGPNGRLSSLTRPRARQGTP